MTKHLIAPVPENKILVTGANGFLGMALVKALLDEGFSVRGAVRSESKGKQLSDKLGEGHGGRFEWVVVDDITKEGAFDEAVKGVAAIEHLASPLNPDGPEPELFIDPAVRGTVVILQSALKYGSGIKRIVITSSCAAIAPDTDVAAIFDEGNWGDDWVEQIKKMGNDAPFMSKYRASKTLSERAAWKFYAQHKDEVDWDLVALNPSVVLGESCLDTSSPENLPSSLNIFYYNIFDPERAKQAKAGSYSFVHVKDVIRTHIQSLNTPSAGGERIIISAGGASWKGTRDIVERLYPDFTRRSILPSIADSEGKGESSGVVKPSKYPLNYSFPNVDVTFKNDKSVKIFGINYVGLDDCIKDTVEDLRRRGFLDAKPVHLN